AKNKIIFWDEAPGAPEWQHSTGRTINSGLYYIYDGVFRDEADIAANTLDYSAVTNSLRPGDMKFVDYDGDGDITPDDRVRRDKNTIPTFQGGLNIGMQYKGFDLTVLFQGATGGELRVGPMSRAPLVIICFISMKTGGGWMPPVANTPALRIVA